jgi:hypothetical protein
VARLTPTDRPTHSDVRGVDLSASPRDASQSHRTVPDPLHRGWLTQVGTCESASPKTTLTHKARSLRSGFYPVSDSSPYSTIVLLLGLSDLPESRHRERPVRAPGAKRRRGPPAGSGVVRSWATCRATVRPPQGPVSDGPVRERSERTSAERQSAREARNCRKRGLAPRPGSRAAWDDRREDPPAAVRRRSR